MLGTVAKVAGDVSSYLEGMVRKLAMESVGIRVDGQPAFPKRIAIGHVDRRELSSDAKGLSNMVSAIESACRPCGAALERSSFTLPDGRRVPVAIVFETVEQAAGFCMGTIWEAHAVSASEAIGALAARLEVLCSIRPGLRRELTVRFALLVQKMRDVDFALYRDALEWLSVNDESGMAVREVPLRGFSRRWLREFGPDLERGLGRCLAFSDLPRRVDFSYLDPGYAATGGPRHASYVEGDACTAPYRVETAIVVSDEETMLCFPDMPGGACILCVAPAYADAVAGMDWVSSCPRLLYWGDMDVTSFSVLDALRGSGLGHISSICMSPSDYRANADLGECRDEHDKYMARVPEIDAVDAVSEMAWLDDDERETCLLCMSTGPVRRIAQSRLPFPDIVL